MPIIRRATEEDIPRIIDLYDNHLALDAPSNEQRPNIPPSDFNRVLAQIQADTRQELLVAEEDGRVIGTMVLIIVPNLSHGGLPWAGIENVVVDSSYHRQGTGKLLMDYAARRAREAGCYKIQLISDKRRVEAHKFYQTLGYEATGHGFRLYL